MPEQPQRPTGDDRDEWKAFWTAQAMPWRTEPEIDEKRQRQLAERRAIQPDIEKGTYPFKDIQLDRADLEWLLATHQEGRGPLIWDGQNHWTAGGLDLRGANLVGQSLSTLPLASCIAGLSMREGVNRTVAQREAAAACLDGADLSGTHLEGAFLHRVQFRHAKLDAAHMQWAELWEADFEGASMTGVQLSHAILFSTNLKAVDLADAVLEHTDLRRAIFDERTALNRVVLCSQAGTVAPWLADVRWGGANLNAIDWDGVQVLFDEYAARKRRVPDWESHELRARGRAVNRGDYIDATRACRQLSIALRAQGLREAADHFDYRGKILYRGVQRRRGRWGTALGSWFLDLISGYGYRPLRSFITYLLVIAAFAVAYYSFGNAINPPLNPVGAVVFSITSFHGRGFSPGEQVGITNPVTILAAGEAITGLLIEITFIATFTQRFFAR